MATTRALSIEDGDLSKVTIAATRNRSYVDIDLSFDKKPTSGEIYKKTNAAAVKQAVKTLLLTNRNEKPFQPYFGANLNNYLFELAEAGSEREIESEIRNAIEVYEPRVDAGSLVVRAKVLPDYNSLDVTIIFKIINTNERVEFTTVLNRLR
jgi:phage baseplate assembly protein W